MSGESTDFVVPEDAVFERAPVLPHDSEIKPAAKTAFHLNGNSADGDLVEYVHVDEHDGTLTHEFKQDIEPVLKNVEQMRNDGGKYAGMTVKNGESNEMRHSARVPQVVVMGWLHQRGMKMSNFRGQVISDFLNDPNNKAFRIWQGRV